MVMSDKLVLWGVGTTRTFRVHWALHELGLPYESRPILPRSGETKTPKYTALNARQKIPLLVDGDFHIGESAAIVAYLSQNYSTPEHALIPEEKSFQAKWLEWCFFIVAELDSTSLYVCAATA
jgi:glutathione S-transferase